MLTDVGWWLGCRILGRLQGQAAGKSTGGMLGDRTGSSARRVSAMATLGRGSLIKGSTDNEGVRKGTNLRAPLIEAW